jgi:hypothetical protein
VQQAAGEGAIRCRLQVAILDQQGDLVGTARQVQSRFLVVTDNIQPGEAGVDVEPGNVHRVVVIPEQGGRLVVVVVAGGRLPREAGVLGPAVADCRGPAPVEMNDRPGWKGCDYLIGRCAAPSWLVLGAVRRRDRDYGTELSLRDGIDPLDLDVLPPLDLDRRSRQQALVPPHLGWR